MVRRLLKVMFAKHLSRKKNINIVLIFSMFSQVLLEKSRLLPRMKMEKTPKLDLLKFSLHQKLTQLVNGKLDQEMKQELLQRPRHSPLQKVPGTEFWSLLLKKEEKQRLRKLIPLIRHGQDSLPPLMRMVQKPLTLLSSKMPHLKMLVFMSSLVLIELVTLRNKDLLQLSLKNHPSPNLWQISPPPLAPLLPLLPVLLVCPGQLLSGTRETRFLLRARGGFWRKNSPMREPSIR